MQPANFGLGSLIMSLRGNEHAVPGAVSLSMGLAGSATDADSQKKAATEKEKVNLEELFKKDASQAKMMDVRTFRKRFSEMLEKGGISTLVVLVDDLDRCTPERIIANLELPFTRKFRWTILTASQGESFAHEPEF